jgi:predicted N-acetyltransferase YhbS
MARKAAKKKKLEMNIREMKDEDIEGVLAVDRKITGQDRALTYTHTPMSFLGGQLAMSVVAEVEGQIVGFVLGQMVNTNYKLGDIAVAQLNGVEPEYHRQHI